MKLKSWFIRRSHPEARCFLFSVFTSSAADWEESILCACCRAFSPFAFRLVRDCLAELFCLLVVECFQEPVAPACCSRPRYDLPSKVFKERTLPPLPRPLSDTYSFVHQYLFCLALFCRLAVVKVNSSSLRFLDIHFLLPRVRRFYFNSQLPRPYTFPRNNNNIAIPNQVFHPNKQGLDRVAPPLLSQS
jgi:hypothetical protein